VEACWNETWERDRHEQDYSRDVHEFDGGHQIVYGRARRLGVHEYECAGGDEVAFARGEKVLFLPDEHLGRNTGYRMGDSAGRNDCLGSIPELGGNSEEQIRAAKVILWKGYCSVHQRLQWSMSRVCGKRILESRLCDFKPGIRVHITRIPGFSSATRADSSTVNLWCTEQ